MIDFVRMFDDYSIDYALEGKNVGQSFVGVHCPWCDDSSYHGGVPRDGGERFSCWRCGSHPFKQTLSIILGAKNVDSILDMYRDDSIDEIIKVPVVSGVSHVTVPGGPLQWYHKKYLEGRRYDPDKLSAVYGVTGTEPYSEYGARVYFPIRFKGETVSFQGRSIREDAYYRYLTAKPEEEKIFHKHLLYNLDLCTDDYIVLVEGVFDALRLGNGACATFGTSYLTEQLLHLKPYKRVFMLYDSEPVAQAKAKKAGDTISHMIRGGVYILDIGQGHDPDDLSDEDARVLMSDIRRVVY